MENAPLVNKNNNNACSYSRMALKKPTPKQTLEEPTVGVKFISAGLAASMGDLLTFPLDTAKVRLQIQGEAKALAAGSSRGLVEGSRSPLYNGVVGTVLTIYRMEGVRGLYSGLVPGLQRQMCFASVRIGLYDAVKEKYTARARDHGLSGDSIVIRLLAGSTTGALAVLCAQPTDVAKVRFQAQPANQPRRYTGLLNAYKTIGREEGLKGLWKGTSPNIARNIVVNCCELVSYDMIKCNLINSGLLSNNVPCHFVSAFGAGFITTVVASPIDVVKTRFMNSSPGTYSGVLNCAYKMFKREGTGAFYKGFMPAFVRLASWNVVMFVCYEQLKRRLQDYNENRNNNSNLQLPRLQLESDNLKRFL